MVHDWTKKKLKGIESERMTDNLIGKKKERKKERERERLVEKEIKAAH